MPTQYETQTKSERDYMGNVVIRFGGVYYAIRKPDSGLEISPAFARCVKSLVLNPNTIDPQRVSTTIGQYSFTLQDNFGIISNVVKDTGIGVIGKTMELWLGRSGVGMAFSDYYKMPVTRINKISTVDAGYSFTTKESTDRMNKPIYKALGRLSGEIVDGTTVIRSSIDISAFAPRGYFRLDNEIISYTSKDNFLRQFNGVARGEFNTTPVPHANQTNMIHADLFVEQNPIDCILQILTSGSGSGAYDVLGDGLAVDPSLIDIAGIEALRNDLFADVKYSLAIYNLDNALQFIEDQFLASCNLRFTFSNDGLLSLTKLNSTDFADLVDTIDHDSLVGAPVSTIDDTKLVNQLVVNWNFNEDTQQYTNVNTYQDDASIALYGLTTSPLNFSFNGPRAKTFIDGFGNELIARLSTPKPEIDCTTFISKSLLNIGDPGRVETTKLANSRGELNFASDMEIVSRAINYQTGEVKLKLAYTNWTGERFGYIAPSDTIPTIVDQSNITLGAGRGDLYQVGWTMRLWNNTLNDYESDNVNTIVAIVGDTITFQNGWTTTLTTHHRIKFADYDQATTSQKRYAFTGITGADFSASEKSYKITP